MTDTATHNSIYSKDKHYGIEMQTLIVEDVSEREDGVVLQIGSIGFPLSQIMVVGREHRDKIRSIGLDFKEARRIAKFILDNTPNQDDEADE